MNGILKSEWIDEECFESFQATKERIDENGRKLPHDFEARRSMKILRDLERKYNLHPSIKGQEQTGREGLRKVNYPAGNVKQQVSSVVRSCLRNYKCSSYGELRTLLERFDVSIEECTGNVDGRDVGYRALQKYYERSEAALKENNALGRLRQAVRDAMSPYNTQNEFW